MELNNQPTTKPSFHLKPCDFIYWEKKQQGYGNERENENTDRKKTEVVHELKSPNAR